MIDRSSFGRQVLGWAAIAVATGLACVWGWWGSIENFHEGWFLPAIWMNIRLLFVQYLSPMLTLMLVSALALRFPRLAMPVMVGSAVAVGWYFRGSRAGIVLIAIPLVVLGILFALGRPEPRRWAWRCLLGLPLATAFVFGTYPGWMAMHRFDDGNFGMRQIAGNGVTLVWAPEGPGWPENGVSWYTAMDSCARLFADGRSLADTPQNVWRLPTIEEVVRSLVFRGNNAAGTWDPVLHRAEFQHTPDKDSPLWKVHSQVIYWWTSSELDQEHAYYVTSNGYVHTVPKRIKPGYLAYRCVAEPGKVKIP